MPMNEYYLRWEPLNGRTGHEAGRALLAKLYREIVGEEMPEITITDRGKPCFREGTWFFSISHTPCKVFCALSRSSIGIDAEELTRQVKPALAEKVLSANEKAQYDAAEDKNRALLTFWVLKEASVKCSGAGLWGYPNRTDFSLDDPRVTEMAGCLLAVVQFHRIPNPWENGADFSLPE